LDAFIKTNIVSKKLKNLSCKSFISRRTKINIYCVPNRIKKYLALKGEKNFA